METLAFGGWVACFVYLFWGGVLDDTKSEMETTRLVVVVVT